MASSPEDLATVAQGAEHIHVHPKTLRRYIAEGRVRAYRVGPRNIRVSLSELDALIQPATPSTSADPVSDLEAHISKVVAAAPPLSAEQRDKLSTLLRGGVCA